MLQGFFAEQSQKCPGYSYVLPCPITNAIIGHLTGLTFWLFVKNVLKDFVYFAEILIPEFAVLEIGVLEVFISKRLVL